MDQAEIDNRFTYHPPRPGQPQIYEAIREQARQLAMCIVALTPSSREQSLAITAVEESVMWANAAVARSGYTPGRGALDQAVQMYKEMTPDPNTLYPDVLTTEPPRQAQASEGKEA